LRISPPNYRPQSRQLERLQFGDTADVRFDILVKERGGFKGMLHFGLNAGGQRFHVVGHVAEIGAGASQARGFDPDQCSQDAKRSHAAAEAGESVANPAGTVPQNVQGCRSFGGTLFHLARMSENAIEGIRGLPPVLAGDEAGESRHTGGNAPARLPDLFEHAAGQEEGAFGLTVQPLEAADDTA
jgi:hypothetical protein